MYLVDTNIISEVRKIGSGRADKGVAAWAKKADPATLYISVISILKLERGILQIARKKDLNQADLLKQWLHQNVLPLFEGRILPIDTETALICASLHIPDPKPANDALIAATALQHRLTLVTRNTAHFDGSKVQLLNPFEQVV